MMSHKYLIPILAIFVLFTVSSINLLAADSVITVTTAPIYHPGQTVVVEGTAPPNVEVGISVYNPNGVDVYSTIVNSTSSGEYSAVLFTFPSAANSQYPYGTYAIKVGTNTGFTNETTFEFEPQLATVVVQVFNSQNIPIQGAKVSAVGTPYFAITNSTGEAVLMLPSGTYTIQVVPPSPYVTTQKTITVVAPKSYTLKFTVEVQEVAVDITKVLGYNSTHATIVDILSPAQNINIDTLGNSILIICAIVTYAGIPVSNATVTATFDGASYPGKYNATVGAYEIMITIPNMQFEGNLIINATYTNPSGTFTATEEEFLTVQYNQEQEILNLTKEVNSLKVELSTLEMYLSGNISYFKGQISTLEMYLSGNVTKLDGELSTLEMYLSGNVSYLNGKISNLEMYLSGNISYFKTELSTLEMYLSGNISYFNSKISTLEGNLSADSTKISNLEAYLSGNVTKLDGELSTLETYLSNNITYFKGQISDLNSKVSSMTTIEYGSLVLAIIGLIIAIVALVLVFRKVA
ncbi:carboxypeptidase regulatory-like domain-containing protein [Acidianus sp. HS-5]|uniref:carboxypeptidase regulatory-like domain-containing protein n=1 Tax=Acidianus sp. HS-5 TaxID=2886040 RepID=UPI001F2277D0|nr:carboxypeptidase regulatory-like domain-containing protein [Acidianus sp. HS-5]BDC19522.1 hypothetical protein HS5_24120 [Acidianus sp. HS-5]